MGSSNLEVYIHFIWHTDDRQALLRGRLEKFVHRRVIEISEMHGIKPLAINSAWTHTHVLTRWNATTKIGDLVKEWKSRTSKEWEPRDGAPQELEWQTGYGSYSIRTADVPGLMRYIGRQKHHHRQDSTISAFERN